MSDSDDETYPSFEPSRKVIDAVLRNCGRLSGSDVSQETMTTEINWDDFSEKKPNRRLGLKVEDKIYWVARDGLADLSPTFMIMLYGSFEESKKDIIELKNKKPDEILELLRRLFPTNGKLKKVDLENAAVLLKLSDEYEINFLLEECKDYLMKEISSFDHDDQRYRNFNNDDDEYDRNVEKMIEIFIVAVQCKLKNIVRATFPFIRRLNADKIQPFFDVLPSEVKNALSSPAPVPITDDEGDCGYSYHEMEEIDFQRSTGCCGEPPQEQCEFCLYSRCSNHARHDVYAECEGCRACRNISPRNGKKQEKCQCINPLADVELEKLGL